MDGEVYRERAFVLLNWQSNDLPKFSRIEEIAFVQNLPFFLYLLSILLALVDIFIATF